MKLINIIIMNNWLEKFKKYWLDKDIDSIIELFTDDFIYYETPYQKISNKSILKKEWECILDHEIKALYLNIYLENDSKLVIKSKYEYILNWEHKVFSWIYLVEIENYKCKYFYQVWE